ncbi:PREDICTED: uncharacterized protein LOC107162304 [Diuraphis noxia]|uniref:uncharacterized protein LOC107162304 n=1 Tax=Diuraphis noxia TaxID=143948 RepID=UPI0007636DB7|nr:PREDICTED: uncharacterized protein LOC107162304 [Diuraphis noxia]
MLSSPVDNNASGSCRDKHNINKQCSSHQESECSVRNIREPIQANSFVEEPEEDFFENDNFTESKSCDREDTGCNIARNGTCEGRMMCEESRLPKETTMSDVNRVNDSNNSRCHRPRFNDEQQRDVRSSRRNSESRTDRKSLQVPTSIFRSTKDPATNQSSALPLTLNNRTLTNRTVKNRSNVTPEFEKELYRVEQRRAQLMRCIERKQQELMMENRKVRTSLQNDCEQQSSGCERQSLHDSRKRRPSQRDTREHRPSHHDIRENRLQSQDDTSKRRQPQHDTRRRRTSQRDTSERRQSHHDASKRQQPHHDTRKRRQSQHDTRERRPSQGNTSGRLPSQHDTREHRISQYDLRERQPLDTKERLSSKGESKNHDQPRGTFVVECFCNFSATDNGCNNEPVTKQVQLDETYRPSARGFSDRKSGCPNRVSSRHNNINADNKTEVKVETARKDAASTGCHSRSGRCSTPRNNACSVTLPDSTEQRLSNQGTSRKRGCPCPRVEDLMSSTDDSPATAVDGNQKLNNRGWNETQ